MILLPRPRMAGNWFYFTPYIVWPPKSEFWQQCIFKLLKLILQKMFIVQDFYVLFSHFVRIIFKIIRTTLGVRIIFMVIRTL
jgi:hypothetical protein